MTLNSTQKQNQSWIWHKVWLTTLIYPTANTGQIILAEGNVTLRRATGWLVLTALLEILISRIAPFIKTHHDLSAQNLLNLLGISLLAELFSLSATLIAIGIIHFLAKIFRSPGNLRDFFILHISFTAPLSIIYGIVLFLRQIFAFEALAWLQYLSLLYIILIVNSIVVKSVYRLNWIVCFFIVLIGSSFLGLVSVFNR